MAQGVAADRQSSREVRSKVFKAIRALDRIYGTPPPQRNLPPLDEVILTLLSQNTNDVNRDRAYESLRRRFPSWENVAEAPVEEVVEAIRVGGLANVKGRRLKEILRRVKGLAGTYSLDFLKELTQGEAGELLSSLPGVGPKTANCVLLFSLGHKVFPVDTHILRVTKRLGILPQRASGERAHELLGSLVPPDRRYSFHLNLIRFGREICTARSPRYEVCPLRKGCLYYMSQVRARAGDR